MAPGGRDDEARDDLLSGRREELFLLVYDELRRLAVAAMRDQRRQITLQPTALVHEAYLKLMGGSGRTFDSRAHFFRTAAVAMRSILVDVARARAAQKRGGGGGLQLTLTESEGAEHAAAFQALAVHDAIAALERIDAQGARIVELRFFCGLEMSEIAALLGTTERTAYRHWEAARAWLFRELSE